MFPDAWTPAELIAAILEARAVANVIGAVRDEADGTRTWVGTGRGVRIEGVQDAEGRIVAVRPTLDQPRRTSRRRARRRPRPWWWPPGRRSGGSSGWTARRQPVVVVARLLDRGQVNYHVERRIRLVRARAPTRRRWPGSARRAAAEPVGPRRTRTWPPVDTSPPVSACKPIPTPSR